jgi:redox-sensitive bicupin YhaK (pirin superfamily)
MLIQPLGFPWQTADPFLFCVHHLDSYPAGNASFGPATSLKGRDLGQDFAGLDGWRMYHGERVPGFPAHPHRGFETVTVVQRGMVDHADSMGAAGRYGGGDVQWMTAGSGVQHSEMFPLLQQDADNPLELFQIWLNLPAHKKMVEPHFKMLWSEKIPVHQLQDASGNSIDVIQYAGALDGQLPLEPTPESWAAEPRNEVAIWVIRLGAGATWTLPAVSPETRRRLYLYEGAQVELDGEHTLSLGHFAEPGHPEALTLENGSRPASLLLLQGRPIGEPVVQYGPFVMNTRGEIQQAFLDFQRTQFGGWPWKRSDPVHGPQPQRFARHADGREEFPQ